MTSPAKIQLHFDLLSRKALLSCEGKDYVLPDTYTDREAAEAEAKRFAWEKLDLKHRAGLRRPSDIEVWLR
ncbi:hypothetical protein [Ensifer soli]|uniref:hypothetical protein n=1 Tax=Ciceribacter sp. sgz301302 TaxID=3342379 RepID=UPI0035B7197E